MIVRVIVMHGGRVYLAPLARRIVVSGACRCETVSHEPGCLVDVLAVLEDRR